MTDAERQAEVLLLDAALVVACEYWKACMETVRLEGTR